jgi:hypothetical protein
MLKGMTTTRKKNPAAVALGRLGGSAPTKKPKGFAAISKKRVREIARAREAAKRAAREATAK